VQGDRQADDADRDEKGRTHDRSPQEGGEAACLAHLVCPDCGVAVDDEAASQRLKWTVVDEAPHRHNESIACYWAERAFPGRSTRPPTTTTHGPKVRNLRPNEVPRNRRSPI
jgi:hypothetical protein